MKKLQRYQKWGIAWTIAGVALFVFFVYQTGVRTIVENIQLFGFSFTFLILITGVRHMMRSVSWYFCMEREHREIGLLELFKIRLIGEAVSDLTFAGPVLGETAKVFAIGKRLPIATRISSVVIENLLFSVSVAVFVLSGLILLFGAVELSNHMRITALVAVGGLCLPVLIAGLFIWRKWLVISRFLSWIENRGFKPDFLLSRKEKLNSFEDDIYNFCRKRPLAAVGITMLELMSNLTNVIEAYLILGVLSGNYSWTNAYLIETVNRIINAVFVLVPMQIGVDEGGTSIAIQGLGYTKGLGVSLAIIRKIRILFWVGVGLIIATRYSFGGKLFSNPAILPEDQAQ